MLDLQFVRKLGNFLNVQHEDNERKEKNEFNEIQKGIKLKRDLKKI